MFWRSEAKKKSLIFGKLAVCGLGFVMMSWEKLQARGLRSARLRVQGSQWNAPRRGADVVGRRLEAWGVSTSRNHFRNSVFLKSNLGMKPNKGSKFWESPHLFEAHIVFVHQRMSETCQHLGKIQHMDICHQEECATSDFWRWSFLYCKQIAFR